MTEWLIRDQGAIVTQMGVDPRRYAADQIEAEGGLGSASRPFTPGADPGRSIPEPAIHTGW